MGDAKLPNLASLKTLGTLPMTGDADVAGLCVGDVCVVDASPQKPSAKQKPDVPVSASSTSQVRGTS